MNNIKMDDTYKLKNRTLEVYNLFNKINDIGITKSNDPHIINDDDLQAVSSKIGEFYFYVVLSVDEYFNIAVGTDVEREDLFFAEYEDYDEMKKDLKLQIEKFKNTNSS